MASSSLSEWIQLDVPGTIPYTLVQLLPLGLEHAIVASEDNSLLDSVEVFRTDLDTPPQAEAVRRELQAQFPGLRVAFDLGDCDRVLRVQSPCNGCPSLWAAVAEAVRRAGVTIEVLPG
jgi:hypothetical protein